MTRPPPRPTLFPYTTLFRCLGAVAAYARRRRSRDADAIAAEVMTIAWRRLADVPVDDPRPWLYATDRKSTRLNSSHQIISYAVFCSKKKRAHSCRQAIDTAR